MRSPLSSPPSLTAASMQAFLRAHVADVWFPRTLDRINGGFHANFDRRWRPSPDPFKLLEQQARQTLLAAELARAYPYEAQFAEAARWGLDFLNGRMSDSDGGWFTRVPVVPGDKRWSEKHLHGAIYAVQANAVCHDIFGWPDARPRATQGLAWIDDTFWDREHGGYFGPTPEWRRGSHAVDHLNTTNGMKDMNVQSDLLELLTYLRDRDYGSVVPQRHDQMLDLIFRHFAGSSSTPYYYWTPDWRPHKSIVRSGVIFQTISRLLKTLEHGADARQIHAAAVNLMATPLVTNWLRHGGALRYGMAYDDKDAESIDRQFQWWPQFEAMRVLVELTAQGWGDAQSAKSANALFGYVHEHFVDSHFGGVSKFPSAEYSRIELLSGARRYRNATVKSDEWKHGLHECTAALAIANALTLHPGLLDLGA